jgi:cytochrome d ubiquinol oxidase subunit II
MMLYFIIIFLWVSLLVYLLMGGADFGAGILELFFSRNSNKQIKDNSYHAMGPIWEANHMWLVIAIVILFVGFPNVYATVSVYLHVPILIMLLGIIARGTSFTFRHYDAVSDDWQIVYNKIFTYSSFITPLFLGIIAGSAVSRTIDTQNSDFVSTYISCWLNWFAVSTGLFTVALCGFLAAIYLIGETKSPVVQQTYRFQVKVMTFAMLACGVLVFLSAKRQAIPLPAWVFGNPISLTAIILATLSLLILLYALSRKDYKYVRPLAGFMVTGALIAVTYIHFPNIVLLKNGQDLSLIEQNAPEKTINVLGVALSLGSLFILPSLIYLVYSVHTKKPVEEQR